MTLSGIGVFGILCLIAALYLRVLTLASKLQQVDAKRVELAKLVTQLGTEFLAVAKKLEDDSARNDAQLRLRVRTIETEIQNWKRTY